MAKRAKRFPKELEINFEAGELFELSHHGFGKSPAIGLITKIEDIEGVELIVHTLIEGYKQVFYNDSFALIQGIRMISPEKPLLRAKE